VFLVISVFHSFVLSSEHLLASELSIQEDVSYETSYLLNENQSACFSIDHRALHFLESENIKNENFAVKPRYSKNAFLLLSFIKCPRNKPLHIYSHHSLLCKLAQNSLPAYLLFKSIRI